jgi:hypothetical protein
VQEERYNKLRSLLGRIDNETPAQLLERLNIHIRIEDARDTTLPDRSIDLIFSTVAFEMIRADVLGGLLKEFRRLASFDAVMSHYVGLMNQYATFDNSIGPYNFLKYSDRWWKFLNNPIIHQNRLRVPDYRELFRKNGWHITEERHTSGPIDELKKIRIAPKFEHHPVEDLLILFAWFVARPY